MIKSLDYPLYNKNAKTIDLFNIIKGDLESRKSVVIWKLSSINQHAIVDFFLIRWLSVEFDVGYNVAEFR
jgi:hypothetical protein